MKKTKEKQIINVNNNFAKLVGFYFIQAKDGKSICEIKVTKKHFNPNNVLHGGVIYSMADTGMGAALVSLLNPNEFCATLEVKINYLKKVVDGKLKCITKVINKTKKIAYLESEIFNEEKQLVAKASGTFYIFNKN
ncbi:MAG: PaaI family thioesterase [Cyanobacteria bacterium]|nr:PaaI family thioesterase [Cyanobacteriota bacterium]